MNENEKKSPQNQAIVIIGLIVLIVGLFVGVKLVFAGLDTAMPDLKTMASDYEERHGTTSEAPPVIGETDAQAPNFCTHCGDELNDTFQWGQFCPYCGKKVE